MNNNIVKEIDIVRELKKDLNNPRYRLLNQAEKALILKSLNDYEDSLTTKVLEHNINAKLMKEDGIEDEEIKVPRSNTSSVKYEFANSLDLVPDKAKIVYLKDILDNYSRGDAFHYNLTDEEWRVLLKALREYAHSLQILIQKAKRNQETYEDIFGSKPQEVKTDWHPSMTQAEIFNELVDKMRSSK